MLINRVGPPAILFSVSLYRFFFPLASFFQHYFSFWPFFLYSDCRHYVVMLENVVPIRNDVATLLQRCVALKIVVANSLV